MAAFRVCLIAFGLLSMTLPRAAGAQTPAYHDMTGTKIPWNRTPDGDDLDKTYPPAARSAGRSGAAAIECLLTLKGGVDDCRVLAESEPGFGEATLKIAPKFGFDTRKMAPESLAGAVLTIPMHWLAPDVGHGRGNGMPPYRAGSDPSLLTPSKSGKATCPTLAHPDQRCDPHEMDWDKSPSFAETVPFVRTVHDGPDATGLLCSARADFQLGPCEVVGPATADQVAAMDQMVRLFTVKAQAKDRTPMTKGLILLRFNWPVMRRAVDASHLSSPAKP